MVTETQVPTRVTLDDVLVVDADIHIHELPGELAAFIEPEWRPVMENLRHLTARYIDVPGFAVANQPQLPGLHLPPPRRGRVNTVTSASQMRTDLDALSIDVGIMFPDALLKLAALPLADYACALARAYHQWVAEKWLRAENDLYAVIVAPPQDPDEAAREIDRWASHERFVGVYLPTYQVQPLWGHRRYDPIYEAAQRHDLPVFFHAVHSGTASVFPYNVEQFCTYIGAHTASHVFAMMANLVSIMETGVPVRYPDLRICFAEAGLTWVPFLRLRLDKEYSEQRHHWPHFNDRPSKWIRGFYFATQPVEEPENRQDLVDMIRLYGGEDTTVFASDWPHHDFDHPRAVFDLPVPERMKRKFLGANALKLMPRIRVPIKYAGEYRPGETL